MNNSKYTQDLSLTSQRCILWSLAVSVLQFGYQFLTFWQSIYDFEMMFDVSTTYHMVIQLYQTGWQQVGIQGMSQVTDCYRCPMELITRRLLVSFLIIWTHNWPIYKYPYLARSLHKWILYSGYRDPIYAYIFIYEDACLPYILSQTCQITVVLLSLDSQQQIAQDGHLTWTIRHS